MDLPGMIHFGAAVCWFSCPRYNYTSPPDCSLVPGRCCSNLPYNCKYYVSCDFGQLNLEECPEFQRFDEIRLECNEEGYKDCYLPDNTTVPSYPTTTSKTTVNHQGTLRHRKMKAKSKEAFLQDVFTAYFGQKEVSVED